MTEKKTDTLSDIDHTHPVENRTFGTVFRRGPTVIADGGSQEPTREPATVEDEQTNPDPTDVTEETVDDHAALGDISHTPPDGDGANRVWDGTQVRDRTDEGADDE